MKYIVRKRRFVRGLQWQQDLYEFDDLLSAVHKAKELHDNFDTSRGDEVTVLVYELVGAIN